MFLLYNDYRFISYFCDVTASIISMNKINKIITKAILGIRDEISNFFRDLENHCQTFLFLPIPNFDAVLSRYLLLPISIRRLFIVFDIPTFFEKIHRCMHEHATQYVRKFLFHLSSYGFLVLIQKLMKYH